MLGNLSAPLNESTLSYPTDSGSNMPFSDYVTSCRTLIENHRIDLQEPGVNPRLIINANTPFELYPEQPILAGNKLKYGALLIHGLFDSPFSLKDIGITLQTNGILCRSILLPGHGTKPSDLLNISYQDWIQAVRYGIESLKSEVEQVFLIGYSTGATLSVYQALHDSSIAGIVLLAPAIKIKAPVDVIVSWRYVIKWFSNHRRWVYREDELDYAKYRSIAFNPVNQVNKLTEEVDKLQHHQPLTCPILMVVSREDETISSHTAIDFFSSTHHEKSRLLLYSAYDRSYPDARIFTRKSHYPDFNISHFSHVSIPFSPNNPHYGQQGDYVYSSHLHASDNIFGAYNHIEESTCDFLYKFGFIKNRRRELTYNPDFDFMADHIVKFIL